jgi:hypothetical protein
MSETSNDNGDVESAYFAVTGTVHRLQQVAEDLAACNTVIRREAVRLDYTRTESLADDLFTYTCFLMDGLQELRALGVGVIGTNADDEIWVIPWGEDDAAVHTNVPTNHVLEDMLPNVVTALLEADPRGAVAIGLDDSIPVRAYDGAPNYPRIVEAARLKARPRETALAEELADLPVITF